MEDYSTNGETFTTVFFLILFVVIEMVLLKGRFAVSICNCF